MSKLFESEAANYTLYGAIFGLCFPVIASVIESYMLGGAVTFNSIAAAQSSAPLLWIIDTAPFFLGLLARIAGKRQDRVKGIIASLDELVMLQTEALQASESKLKTILENTDQGIYGVDLVGRCTYINEAALNALGFRQEECLGIEIHGLVHHSHSDGTVYPLENCPMHHTKLTGTSSRVNYETLWRKDGTPIPVEYSSHPIQENGKDIGAVVTFTDISERKRLIDNLELSHNEAERSNRLLNAILENMADWAWEINAERRYVYCSSNVENFLGYTPDEIIGRTPFDLMPSAEAQRLGILFLEASKLKLPIKNVENWNIAKDGRRRLLITNGVPIIDEIGNLTGYRGVDRDITDVKHLESELYKLSRAVIQSPVSILITDLSGKIEFVNPRFSELTGYTAEEAIGQNPSILNSGQTPLETFKSLWASLTSGEIWEGEFHNKGKYGQHFWEHAVISALRDESGTITHYLAVKEDITEKKQILDQLSDAKEKAEAATIAKSQFLASMSHEIRTPMNGVIGMTHLLLETDLTEEQRQYAEVVNKSGENLLALINDILDFSKIEAGKLDIEILVFDIRTTMEDTAEMLAMRASQKGLELICNIDPAVPEYLKGDPGRLRQIITNLAGNSIKFTHQGEIVISASLKSEENGFVVIRFEITDTGIGIPANRIDALFSPFTQVDGSTTRKYGGTGLGLAICKQLTELMGGEIGIESEEGKGSTFWFTVRFEKQTEVPIVTEVLADITGTKILVVDDNAANRLLMTTLLKHWGCRYEAAEDGDAALALLHKAVEDGDLFRVALLDYEMPGMDGSELGRRIKGDPQLESTLMIMVTSLAQRGDAASLQQIGFVGYLPKPVRQKQLRECIAIVLGRGDKTPIGIVTQHTTAEVESRSGTSLRGIRILLAEDNIINQKVAQSILGKIGYKADVVANGLEAVRALEMINYDVVLMDCQMPEMDGFEATAMIRDPQSKVLNHSVPIIAMTANAMKGDRENCIEAGMDDYLTKPVKKEALAAILNKWG